MKAKVRQKLISIHEDTEADQSDANSIMTQPPAAEATSINYEQMQR